MNQVPHQRLLYIEDDAGLAALLRRRLERHQFSVTVAASAEDGLLALDEQPFDVVLLDYNLPGMSGLEFLDVVRTRENSPPVIVLTTGGDERVAVAALEKGAADYAVKDPGQSYFDLLPAVIHATITRDQLQRENVRQQEELQREKEKAEAANLAKSNFLATMSHEIRTPLNVVIGLAGALSKTSLDDKQKDIVETLSGNANILLRLINDLLDINRIEGGHVELEKVPFRLDELLIQLQQMFSKVAADKGVALRMSHSVTTDGFLGDPTRVQQILINLISNALKFTERGEVRVEIRGLRKTEYEKWLEVVVTDTGLGIDEKHLPYIFNKFTQADGTITRRFGGSGLGLAIARSLAQLMGGDITVESALGKGSRFVATFAIQRDSVVAQATPQHPTPKAEQIGNQREILLVEDYAPNVMVATLLLEDLGYQVKSVENGLAALAAVEERTSPFAAILMDVQMHGMDGLETTRRIRMLEQEKPFNHPIIGVTAHALAGDRERCLAAGMSDYISKPIHPDILADKLQKIA